MSRHAQLDIAVPKCLRPVYEKLEHESKVENHAVFLSESDVVLGQTSQSVSYRPRYDACRNIGVGLKMVTTLTLVVYTCIMGIEPPTKS